MKKIILVLFAIIGFCCNVSAQNYSNVELFQNEKLGIFHTVKNGNDALPGEHYVSFDNYTNNNLRVTYKVNVRVIVIKTRSYKDFTYTETVYIKPKGSAIDLFWNNRDVYNYLQSNSGSQWFTDTCRLLFNNFELVNYGVEQKNYETSY